MCYFVLQRIIKLNKLINFSQIKQTLQDIKFNIMEDSNLRSSNIKKKKDIQSVKQIIEFQDFFTKYQQRSCTDIFCLIVGLAFSLIFIIVCFAVHNQGNYMKANFPADTDGQLCGIDYPGYSFIYFTSPSDITERVCVSKCPESKDTKLDCKSTNSRGCRFNQDPTYGVVYYPNQAVTDRSGSFCLPTQNPLRQDLINKAKLNDRNIFYNSSDAIKMSAWISIIFALVYFLLVQFFPKIINRYVLYVGCGVLFVLVILTFVYSTPYTGSKIFVGIILVLLLVFIVVTVFLFSNSIEVNGIFLQQATRFVWQNLLILINIPIFIGIQIGFAFLLVMELNSLLTGSSLNFDPSSGLYYEYAQSGPIIGSVFLVIQAIWGFSFIKQSFNFIASGYATLWYYGLVQQNMFLPYKLYFMKHMGSVIAQSFMVGFFAIFDALFDLLRLPKQEQNGQHFRSVFISCSNFFDMVRSQALAYINITGNPYCNSSRYCEYLCSKSQAMTNSQSASRSYRICAYVTLAGITGILALYVQGQISIMGLGMVIILSYFIVNFFVQVHADTGDAILIIFLQHQQFSKRQGFQKGGDWNRDAFKSHSKGKGITYDIIKQLQKNNLFADQKVRSEARRV